MSKSQNLNLYLAVLFVLPFTAFGQTLNPHPVPEEFASDYYHVTVNGTKVPVFHAGLNVYFTSFDFSGKADVVVEKTSKNKIAGQNDAAYWGSNAVVRPLAKAIKSVTAASKV